MKKGASLMTSASMATTINSSTATISTGWCDRTASCSSAAVPTPSSAPSNDEGIARGFASSIAAQYQK